MTTTIETALNAMFAPPARKRRQRKAHVIIFPNGERQPIHLNQQQRPAVYHFTGPDGRYHSNTLLRDLMHFARHDYPGAYLA
jgi:hypothetical protein